MEASKVNFRKDLLVSLQPQTKRYHISDDKVPGLRLAVYPSGVKTFLLCRKINGVTERIKIGRFPDLTIEQARNEAKRLNSLIILGGNPHKERIAERKAVTFRELYDHYYHHHALKFTKRPDANRKMMEYQVFPVFGNQKAHLITTEQIRNFHTKIGETQAKSTANRLIAVVSAAYNFGIRENFIQGINPCAALRKYSTTSRDRFLSFEELKSFQTALKEENELFRDFFNVLLHTGARKSNVLSMKWSDINFDLNIWRIPETHTKNKEVNIVPLSETALTVLRRRHKRNLKSKPPTLFVFPGTGPDGYLKDPKKAFNRIRKRMNVYDIRMHDLRRTLGSYMAISGASLPMIGKALNHKSQISTAIYARLSNDLVANAVNIASKLMVQGKN